MPKHHRMWASLIMRLWVLSAIIKRGGPLPANRKNSIIISILVTTKEQIYMQKCEPHMLLIFRYKFNYKLRIFDDMPSYDLHRQAKKLIIFTLLPIIFAVLLIIVVLVFRLNKHFQHFANLWISGPSICSESF